MLSKLTYTNRYEHELSDDLSYVYLSDSDSDDSNSDSDYNKDDNIPSDNQSSLSSDDDD